MRNPSLFPGASQSLPAVVPGEARTFTGDGTGRVVVAGCVAVAMVLVSGAEIPQYYEQKYPTDLTERPNYVSQSIPLWDLAETEDGIPCLVRHYQSNDGLWQEGATITVIGDWAPDPAETLPRAARGGRGASPAPKPANEGELQA